ncbi:MAG: hypothetical protein KKD31_12250 [Bacteroidetes bacterium]|nr:hypothetical protein [Bacteroidota bacterium]
MRRLLLLVVFFWMMVTALKSQTWSVIGDTLGCTNNECINDVFVHGDVMHIEDTFWNIGSQQKIHVTCCDGTG